MTEGFDIAPFGYFTFGDDGLLLDTNDSFRQLLKVSGHNINGTPLENFLTIPSRIFYQTHLFPLLKMQGRVEEIFLTLQDTEKKTIPVLLNAIKHAENGVICFRCAFITVYHRKKFEDELLAARKKAELALQENSELQLMRDQLLRQSEYLDRQLDLVQRQNHDLRQVTKAVTHELQEPVRKILTFSMMISTEGNAVNAHDALPRLTRSTYQLKKVLQGLQTYLWLQESRIKPVAIDLNSILEQVKKQLNNEYNGEVISLSLQTLPHFEADSDQIRELCYHILSNSVRFRKNGEVAEVIVRGTEIRKNKYKILKENYSYEQFVKLEFIDNGKGFEPEFRYRVLELFQRLADGEGRGVGLALCKTIADNHGGNLQIESVPGEGTTVSVLLPLIQSSYEATE